MRFAARDNSYTRWKERNERPLFSLLPLSRQRVSLFPVFAVSPVLSGDFQPRSRALCILLSLRKSVPEVYIMDSGAKCPTRHPNSANFSLCTPHYLNRWKRLSPKVVKDRSYFTESASFQLTKLTGLTCSFRYQKPTDFHRKRLNLLTQKPLYLHVTLNILDD